ncbi:uncharacterized protein BDZ99DRAFT_199671 [Mytilinidion resinicola]|uniref:Uncharacterized protein n=1 Tax=Mytilinidion resinicola TaxID=574789 RepID=A0A6A6Y2B4_9PEZI|nr:uncharacterized protein BDZ99DRAFT_199671 [Mytilinidion resinicola]KAF2802779.1 hypothetical protein BDZ99DRAFT_199671 [Mytilinidion resinicola]
MHTSFSEQAAEFTSFPHLLLLLIVTSIVAVSRLPTTSNTPQSGPSLLYGGRPHTGVCKIKQNRHASGRPREPGGPEGQRVPEKITPTGGVLKDHQTSRQRGSKTHKKHGRHDH